KINEGEEDQSFHKFADYTLTEHSETVVKHSKKSANNINVVYCRSEGHPARCHRLIISNWLAAEGDDVYHIIKQGERNIIELHELGKWGAMPIIVEDGTVAYPKLDESS